MRLGYILLLLSAILSDPSSKDFYERLGLQKTATVSEIKKAYRKLAVKWHPDKNPKNRAAAEVNFKKIAEAYEVLNNADARQKYDMFGPEGQQGGDGGFGFEGFHFHDPGEIFEQFFQSMGPGESSFHFFSEGPNPDGWFHEGGDAGDEGMQFDLNSMFQMGGGREMHHFDDNGGHSFFFPEEDQDVSGPFFDDQEPGLDDRLGDPEEHWDGMHFEL